MPTMVSAQITTALALVMGPTWRQTRVDDVTVIGPAGGASLERIASDLAIFRSALLTHNPHIRVTGSVPTFVVVLEDFDAYKRYQPKDSLGRRMDSVAGYINVTAEANFLVVPYVRGEIGRSLVYHEYMHYLIRQNATTFVPFWLEEGLAEFYSTFRPDTNVLGGPAPARVSMLRQQPHVPLRELLNPRRLEQMWQSPLLEMFYAEAWALVHHISLGRRNPVAAPFTVYLTTLDRTGSQDAAFKAAFGADVAAMDRELRDYVKHYSYRTIEIPVTVAVETEAARPVPEADARRFEGSLEELNAPSAF